MGNNNSQGGVCGADRTDAEDAIDAKASNIKGGEATAEASTEAKAESTETAELTDEEKVQLKANFDAIDTDGSGTLDMKEFTEAMKLAFAEHPDKPEMPSDEALEAEFKKCDTDESGTIELEEFYAVFTAIKRGEDGGLLGKMGGGFAAVLGDVADGAVAGAKFAWTPFAFAWGATGGKVVEAVSGEAEAVRVGVRVHDKCENCQSLYEAKGGCALM